MLTWFAIFIQKHVLLFVSYQVHKHFYYCSDELEFNQLSPESHYIDEGGSATATIQQNVSFKELMETPKIKKKGVCRKKSLNYKAQLVTEKLFYGSKNVTFKKQSKNVLPKKKQKRCQRRKRVCQWPPAMLHGFALLVAKTLHWVCGSATCVKYGTMRSVWA